MNWPLIQGVSLAYTLRLQERVGKEDGWMETDRSISTTLDQCVSLPHDWQPRRDRVGELAQAAAPQGVSAHENVRCRPKGREGIVVVTSPVVRGGLAEVISASQARGALWGFGQTLCSHFIEEDSRICLQSKVMKNSIFFMMCMCVRVRTHRSHSGTLQQIPLVMEIPALVNDSDSVTLSLAHQDEPIVLNVMTADHARNFFCCPAKFSPVLP